MKIFKMKSKNRIGTLGCVIALVGIILVSGKLHAQKVNTDSLLVSAYQSLKDGQYIQAIAKARRGKKEAPEYLDFYVVLGRANQLTKQKDSARYYYSHVLERNEKYEEAYTYWIGMELEDKNYDQAEILLAKARKSHPENSVFPMQQWRLYQDMGDFEKERTYLRELSSVFPSNSEITQRIFWLDSRYNSDRFGLQHTYTNFERDGIGPWHLSSVQYIRERKWGSIIGRVNYANRMANKETIAEGIQVEAETYFFTGKKSYAHLFGAYSGEIVFPEWRVGANYFQTLTKGWELDFGVRYTRVDSMDLPALTLGVGTYFGSYWVHVRSFFQEQESKWYPAFTLTTRYYLDSRFDYLNFVAGYGTSADESYIQSQLQNRISLNSYRVGLGYFRQLGGKFLVGAQGGYNRQEYLDSKWQNEWEAYLMFQYRL